VQPDRDDGRTATVAGAYDDDAPSETIYTGVRQALERIEASYSQGVVRLLHSGVQEYRCVRVWNDALLNR